MKQLCAVSFRIALKSFLMLALTFASVTGALAAPCVSATSQCTEFVPVRGGPGRVLVYRSAPLLVRDEAITHVLIVIHGAERDAAISFRIAAAGAVLRVASRTRSSCRHVLPLAWEQPAPTTLPRTS